jgi:uncharacterized OB-fold protein
MAEAAANRKCHECGGSTHPIKIIDKSGRMDEQSDLEYALPESKRSFWFGELPVEGVVLAEMCNGCGRISLYGGPRA